MLYPLSYEGGATERPASSANVDVTLRVPHHVAVVVGGLGAMIRVCRAGIAVGSRSSGSLPGSCGHGGRTWPQVAEVFRRRYRMNARWPSGWPVA